MTAAFVKECESWPEAGPLELEVLQDDGEYAHLFTTSTAEVALIQRDGPGGALVVPLAFHTFEQADRAGKLLAAAFENVKEIQAEPKPRPCALHRYRIQLFARGFQHTAVCTRCGTVADVVPREATA